MKLGRLLGLLAFLCAFFCVLAVPAWAQAPDQQESICTQSWVVLCDNFEDRVTGNLEPMNTDMHRAKYKNQGWGVGWPSAPYPMGVFAGESWDGSKALRFDYAACNSDCLNGYTGGSTFIDSGWSGTTHDYYFRWYERWSSNYTLSPFADKNVESMAGNLFANQSGDPVLRYTNAVIGSPPPVNFLSQNKNSPFQTVPGGGVWHCYEVHLKHNDEHLTNGVVEAWVDDVLKMQYTNQLIISDGIWDSSTGQTIYQRWGTITNILIGTYMNGGQTPTPAQQKWFDNIVIGTQRIGCLGNPPPTLPAAPGNLHFISLIAGLLGLAAAIGSAAWFQTALKG